MGLTSDIQRLWKYNGSLLRSRAAGRALTRRLRELPPLEPGTVDIAVYFADDEVNMYQIRQWYKPLADLARHHGVAIISRSSTAALRLLDESPVSVVYARKVTSLEHFVARQQAKIVLYVNQNTRNFQMFRYGQRFSVFINHGESDKVYMTTNQFSAYDYAFVAGQAALDRLGRALWNYDFDRRAIPIGRPQADWFAGELPYTPDERIVVLYAPTWEGDRASAAYGSIETHGERLVETLLANPRYRVLYRPHPRSGVVRRSYGQAHKRIVAALAEANRRDPQAQHIYDDGPEMGWQLAAADIAVCDISAMVYDRLAVGKPLLITRPASEEAAVDERGYLGACEWLTEDRSGEIVEEVERLLTSPDAIERLNFWVRHHFGDTGPGAASARFRAAIDHLMAEWDRNAMLHPDEVRAAKERRDEEHVLWQERVALFEAERAARRG